MLSVNGSSQSANGVLTLAWLADAHVDTRIPASHTPTHVLLCHLCAAGHAV
jgi:hypothetical protein